MIKTIYVCDGCGVEEEKQGNKQVEMTEHLLFEDGYHFCGECRKKLERVEKDARQYVKEFIKQEMKK